MEITSCVTLSLRYIERVKPLQMADVSAPSLGKWHKNLTQAASRRGGGTRGARARTYMQRENENELGSIEERHAYLEFSVTRTIRIASGKVKG